MSGKRAKSHLVAIQWLYLLLVFPRKWQECNWFSPASRTVLWIPRSQVYSLKIKQSRGNHGFYRPKIKASCQMSIQFWERKIFTEPQIQFLCIELSDMLNCLGGRIPIDKWLITFYNHNLGCTAVKSLEGSSRPITGQLNLGLVNHILNPISTCFSVTPNHISWLMGL